MKEIKLELLVETDWIELGGPEMYRAMQGRLHEQATPMHFDSDKYQFFVKKVKNGVGYTIYRVLREQGK